MTNWSLPERCTKCHKYTKKADGEGYDTLQDDHKKFRLGRVCDNCNIVFLNPDYASYEIIKNSEIGR